MGKLISWLVREQEGAFPIFDKYLLFLLKIAYLSFKIFSYSRRDTCSYTKQALWFNDYLAPSYHLLKLFYKVLKLLRLGNPVLLKISVPKYDYKFYCRINKEDFTTHSSTRDADEVVERFLPKEGDVVVDIGAHVGRYTMISSKRVGIDGKVIAIEAHCNNFNILQSNIKLNHLPNVIALNYAVSSKEMPVKLYLPGEELGYTIYNTLMAYRTDNEKRFIEVNANTLDNLLHLNGITEVHWIKIDVEGAEFDVLKGAENVLSLNEHISLLIEIHGLDNYAPIIEFLTLRKFNVEFEKSYKSGDKHIIVKKKT